MAAAPERLHVVALVSGGKDSFYALMHCLVQGHDVVALANLHPLEPDSQQKQSPSQPDDIESHMYQTVGHAVIPLYAQALGIPLHRQAIRGEAADRGLEYSGRKSASKTEPSAQEPAVPQSDETEDLATLLSDCKAAHPEINAVCAGAILSTYQRTRVEAVAVRLGLTSLAPLWQYPSLPTPQAAPGSLLEHAAAAGLDARVVKVAAAGLDENLLWASLAHTSTRNRISAAAARFGASVLGEGGEFETLVVAGPPDLWKARLDVQADAMEVVALGAGEALLRIDAAKVRMESRADEGYGEDWKKRVRVPELFDANFERALRRLSWPEGLKQDQKQDDQCISGAWEIRPVVLHAALTVRISNISSRDGNPAQQTTGACAGLDSLLRVQGRGLEDVVFCTLILRSMSDFAAVNTAYGHFFSEKPLPPARVAVAAGDMLPNGVFVVLSAVAAISPRARRSGLHVQSRSYWAPANIGPYSQAVAVPVAAEGHLPALQFVAGQIPLVPATMQPLSADCSEGLAFLRSAVLAAQHLWRIGLAVGVSWWAGGVAFLAGGGDCDLRARKCWDLWCLLHARRDKDHFNQDPGAVESEQGDSDPEFDVWHQKHGMATGLQVSDGEKVIPDLECLKRGSGMPGFFAVEMSELPRGCPVEWQGLGLAGAGVELTGSEPTTCGVTALDGTGVRVTFHEFALGEEQQLHDHLQSLKSVISYDDNKSAALRSSVHATLYTPHPHLYSDAWAQVVPCKAIWGRDGVRLGGGLVECEEMLPDMA